MNMTPTTTEREAREILEATAGGDVIVTEGGARAHINLDWAIRAIIAALARQEAQQECPKCGGTGGERWHEADGSENGARCDACDGFGTQQEAQGAVAEVHSGTLRWIEPDDDLRPMNCKLYTTPPAPVDVRVDESVRDALALLERATYHDGRYRQMEHDDWQQEAQQLLPRLRALLDGQPAGVVIDPKDVTVESWPPRPSPGGQHVGTGPCGVKVTHKPSGLVVCFDRERSQHHNRQRAMAFLQAALGGGGGES